MSHKKFVCNSLNTHLFFARIMKEHAVFLEAGFTSGDSKLCKIACDFNCKFGEFLVEAIHLADGHIDDRVIKSHEIYTDCTIDAEEITHCLTGIKIPSKITMLSKEINPAYDSPSSYIVEKVYHLNHNVCNTLKKFILFKQDILNEVNKGHLFTFSYPSLLDHLIEEAKHYLNDITDIEKEHPLDEEIYEHELFWSEIMCEHMEILKGLIDYSEKKALKSVHEIYDELEKIRHKIEDHPDKCYIDELIKEVKEVRKFKSNATEGILNHEIKSVIVPLMADHILREANHFLRILKEYKHESEFEY